MLTERVREKMISRYSKWKKGRERWVRETKLDCGIEKFKNCRGRPAEKQQAGHSISACTEALMVEKMASSTPSHQAKCAAVTEEDYRLHVADGAFKTESSVGIELNLQSNLA